MARNRTRIQPMESGIGPRPRPGRIWIILTMVIVAVIALAWFDGGEQPIRPISQPIAMPEGR